MEQNYVIETGFRMRKTLYDSAKQSFRWDLEQTGASPTYSVFRPASNSV